MSKKLCAVTVQGLFGYVNHEFDVDVASPCILTGPNGAGKTHVLRLIRAGLALDVGTLIELPYRSLRLNFNDGIALRIDKEEASELEPVLYFSVFRGANLVADTYELADYSEQLSERHLPAWIVHLPDGRWYDKRSERFYPRSVIERRFNVNLGRLGGARFDEAPHVVNAVKGIEPILIDTKRLDTQLLQRGSERYSTQSPPQRSMTQIEQYIDQIRVQVVEARRASLLETQDADLSFASRALQEAHATVNLTQLKARYSAVVDQYAELASNGLAAGTMPLEFPNGQVNPTAKRILNVFVADWERRLKPLLPLNEKIKSLRRILDGKLAGKKTHVDPSGAFGVASESGDPLTVSLLSSGEQHLVALFTLLLFSAEKGALVLIDEPELSMHAAWKHDFLTDIEEVSRLNDLQIVMATHSTGIINGRWGLTRELAVQIG